MSGVRVEISLRDEMDSRCRLYMIRPLGSNLRNKMQFSMLSKQYRNEAYFVNDVDECSIRTHITHLHIDHRAGYENIRL